MGDDDLCAIGNTVAQRLAQPRFANHLRPFGEAQTDGQDDVFSARSATT